MKTITIVINDSTLDIVDDLRVTEDTCLSRDTFIETCILFRKNILKNEH